jgi:two-component system phosphate regulon sensor histidine kinase PhoR
VRLTQRLLLQTLGIIVVLVASVVIIIDSRLHQRIVDETILELSREARLVAIEWRPGADADDLADRAGAATGHRVTLISPNGTVIGDTDFDLEGMRRLQNHGSRPEVVDARRTGVGSFRRLSASTGQEQLYVAVRAPLGVSRVSVTTPAVEEIFDAARRDVLLAGFLSLLLATALSVLFSRAISRPIVQLRNVARSLAAGDLSARPALAAPGEVGDLADAVYRMSEQLAVRLRALDLEQSRLSTVIDALNEGVIAVAPEHNVVRISAIARDLLDLHQPVPFPVDFIPREGTLRKAIADALRGDPTGPVEIRIGEKVVSLNARPLSDGGAVLALFDLTPTKRLESVRRDFVANVSHELRTPLTVISGFAETLAAENLPPDRTATFARAVLSHARRMQQLVDDLLDLSRIESGGWKPNRELVQLTELVAEILSQMKTTAETKGVKLLSDISPGAEQVRADRTAIAQIFANLLENAIRHTDHGTVTAASAVRADAIEITVSDTGSGISPEHLPRIFERFYRADPGRSRESGGTGLGLAIVKHLAEAHGGSASVSSEVGKGTTIKVLLPQAAALS